jgi:hypothetical protein
MAQYILNVFNLLEKELLNQKTSQNIMGGSVSQTTEPYKHFEDSMNEIYDYVKDVFETNEKNKKDYSDSVKNMDKDCDCEKYKVDKKLDMKTSIQSSPIIFTLKDADRQETETKIKNEWIL